MAGRVDVWLFGWVIRFLTCWKSWAGYCWVVYFLRKWHRKVCAAQREAPATDRGCVITTYRLKIWCLPLKCNVWFEDAENLQSPFYYLDLWRFGLGDCSFHSEERTNWRGIHTECFWGSWRKTGEAVLPGGSSCATERWLNYGFGIRNILSIWMKWCLASDLE